MSGEAFMEVLRGHPVTSQEHFRVPRTTPLALRAWVIGRGLLQSSDAVLLGSHSLACCVAHAGIYFAALFPALYFGPRFLRPRWRKLSQNVQATIDLLRSRVTIKAGQVISDGKLIGGQDGRPANGRFFTPSVISAPLLSAVPRSQPL